MENRRPGLQSVAPNYLLAVDNSACQLRTVRPEKLVLLIPLNRREYDEFRERTRGSFPCQLPEYQGRRIPITSIRAVVCFDHEWIPSIVPVQQTKREYWRRAAASALSTDVFFRTRSKLRDVLEDTLLRKNLRCEVKPVMMVRVGERCPVSVAHWRI